jgi:hypothetical protein
MKDRVESMETIDITLLRKSSCRCFQAFLHVDIGHARGMETIRAAGPISLFLEGKASLRGGSTRETSCFHDLRSVSISGKHSKCQTFSVIRSETYGPNPRTGLPHPAQRRGGTLSPSLVPPVPIIGRTGDRTSAEGVRRLGVTPSVMLFPPPYVRCALPHPASKLYAIRSVEP